MNLKIRFGKSIEMDSGADKEEGDVIHFLRRWSFPAVAY